ncbi:hypothetical protein MTDSW087_01401 [Methylobacterium dankookense]|uniref:Recombinase domain-containing protein n=2 Tax=Methylobacterium dankookense TaxID=560405 RepID=A0A564FUN5_9HYPH|nr:hypothetical protein IFDJLNFL_2678 [Methylobacterium dankookense]VUF11717.1 hypothetical protein MTDSW087_01401 [Methylobacterium dankookense]
MPVVLLRRLGNPTNLPEAQAKGAEANKARADREVRELMPLVQQLRQAGKEKAHEIAEGLNAMGRQTSRGESWKPTNIRRLSKQVDELEAAQRAAEEAKRYEGNPSWGAFS